MVNERRLGFLVAELAADPRYVEGARRFPHRPAEYRRSGDCRLVTATGEFQLLDAIPLDYLRPAD